MIVPDNATEEDLGEEPEGFWDDVHSQVDAWIEKYGDDEPD